MTKSDLLIRMKTKHSFLQMKGSSEKQNKTIKKSSKDNETNKGTYTFDLQNLGYIHINQSKYIIRMNT